jgi:hypothetical protein
VGGGRHRQPVPGRVEPGLGQGGVDGGEALGEALQAGGVEPHVVAALVGQHGHDRLADLVPGEQLVHEAFAVQVPQQGAVAAQGLGQERPGHGGVVQRRGVELHELQVGDRHPGPQRHGDAVAGGLGRVRGHREHLPGAAGGDQHVAGPHLGPAPRGRQGGNAGAPPVLHDQVQGEPVLVHRGRGALHRLHQGPFHLGAGGRAPGVDHPGVRVAALPGQQQLACGVAVEDGAEGDQLVDPPRPLVHQHPDRVGVAEPGTSGERVGQVDVGRVGVAGQHRGHPALGPAGRGLVELGLGQHPHPQAVQVRRPHGGRQPGHAGPEDQQVERDVGQWAGTST